MLKQNKESKNMAKVKKNELELFIKNFLKTKQRAIMTEPINEFELVKSKVKIEHLIGAYISFDKINITQSKLEETYIEAACPFEACKGKNGFFVLKPLSNMFYCFDCHECGDHISFISTMEKLTPKDAFNFIITKYNLDIPYKN